MACLLAVAIALTLWVVLSGRGDGGTEANGPGRHTPAPSITPGPGSSTPAVTERPGGGLPGGGGGGDTGSGDTGGGDTGGDEDSGGTDGGEGGVDGKGDAAGGSGGSASDGNGSGGTAGGGSGGSGGSKGAAALADCASGDVRLKLRSVKNSYEPGEKPRFELTATNTGGACRIDVGPVATVVTVTDVEDDRIWSSKDCPDDRASAFLRVPGDGETVHTFEWDRHASEPRCATPTKRAAGTGTYLVKIEVPGLGSKRVSFVLAAS